MQPCVAAAIFGEVKLTGRDYSTLYEPGAEDSDALLQTCGQQQNTDDDDDDDDDEEDSKPDIQRC